MAKRINVDKKYKAIQDMLNDIAEKEKQQIENSNEIFKQKCDDELKMKFLKFTKDELKQYIVFCIEQLETFEPVKKERTRQKKVDTQATPQTDNKTNTTPTSQPVSAVNHNGVSS